MASFSSVWVKFVSVAVWTWRVTALFYSTAAFLLKLGHQLSSAVHGGSDAAVWHAASDSEGERERAAV